MKGHYSIYIALLFLLAGCMRGELVDNFFREKVDFFLKTFDEKNPYPTINTAKREDSLYFSTNSTQALNIKRGLEKIKLPAYKLLDSTFNFAKKINIARNTHARESGKDDYDIHFQYSKFFEKLMQEMQVTEADLRHFFEIYAKDDSILIQKFLAENIKYRAGVVFYFGSRSMDEIFRKRNKQ